jgi:hypothetical protein
MPNLIAIQIPYHGGDKLTFISSGSGSDSGSGSGLNHLYETLALDFGFFHQTDHLSTDHRNDAGKIQRVREREREQGRGLYFQRQVII